MERVEKEKAKAKAIQGTRWIWRTSLSTLNQLLATAGMLSGFLHIISF